MRPSAGIGLFVFPSTVVLGGMIAASGCTVLTNDGLPDDAGTFEGGDATVETCGACLGQECTGQWAACLTDPACIAVVKRATSATCEADSGTDGGVDPLALYDAFLACGAAKAGAGAVCAADCSGASEPAPCASDAGIDDAGPSDASDATDASDDAGDASIVDGGVDAEAGPTEQPEAPSVDACTSCVSGKCGDAKKACAIASECAAYLECAFAAADAALADECGRQHATGKVAAVELATCTRVGCSDPCGF